MTFFETLSVIPLFTALGAMGTCAGAVFVIHVLKSNHDWQRRQYALDIYRDWNKNTSEHYRAIENALPRIRDIDKNKGSINELSKDRARIIYGSDPLTDSENFALRFHITQLLNYLEFVATAYNSNVADEQVILETMKNPIISWVNILSNFLEVSELSLGYQPWQPLRDTVKQWEHNPKIRRLPTA